MIKKLIIFIMILFIGSNVYAKDDKEPKILNKYGELYTGKIYRYHVTNANKMKIKWYVKGDTKDDIEIIYDKSTRPIIIVKEDAKIKKCTIGVKIYKNVNGKLKLVKNDTDKVVIKKYKEEYKDKFEKTSLEMEYYMLIFIDLYRLSFESNENKDVTFLEYLSKNIDEKMFEKYYLYLEKKDSDGDGLSDEFEEAYGIDPYDTDTDKDGLSDYFEVVCSSTDPCHEDTYGDGIKDGDRDKDGDGLTELEEQKYKTAPYFSDSDFDLLNDYDEIKKYKTNPLKEDTDGDGLSDYLEVNYNLNPRKKEIVDNKGRIKIKYELPNNKIKNKKNYPSIEYKINMDYIHRYFDDIIENVTEDFPDKYRKYLIDDIWEINLPYNVDEFDIFYKVDKKLINDKNKRIVLCYYKYGRLYPIENQKLDKKTSTIIAKSLSKNTMYTIIDYNKLKRR